MLNIEIIKFEAQDVITTSVAAPTEGPCDHMEIDFPDISSMNVGDTFGVTCKDCPATGVGTLEEIDDTSFAFTVDWN